MNDYDISKLPNGGSIYFIGIGGISMSGLAQILIDRGFKIYGSDTSESKMVDRLRNMGAKINIGQKKKILIGAMT